MSAVALQSHYISAGHCGMMYGQQGSASQAHLYDQKLYDTAKAYGDAGTTNSATAAAYMSWQTPFKYDSLASNWSSTAAANTAANWYGSQAAQGINLGQIVKPDLHDYTR